MQLNLILLPFISTTKINMRLLGHKVKDVKPLNESAAVSAGADVIGETLIYSVSASVILAEYWRREKQDQAKSAQKKERQRVKQEKLDNNLRSLNERITELYMKNEELLNKISALEEQVEAQPKKAKESTFSRLIGIG